MSLESEILSDLRQLLSDHGVKARETYITRIQKRVGFAKGSWINAGKSISGRVRGAAQWATRHKQAPGSAVIKTGDKASVTLVNNPDYIDDVTTYKTVSLALEVAAGRLRKALSTSLRKINDRTNRVPCCAPMTTGIDGVSQLWEFGGA
jgi:hypothetical protein